MEKIDTFEVTFDRKTYEVLSANTEFYAFIGERMFRTFEQLLVREDADALRTYIENEKNVLLNLLTESDVPRKYLALLDAGEKYVSMRMVPFDRVHEWGKQMRGSADRKRGILELIDDYYFEYDAEADHMRLYSINIVEEDMINGTLADFEEMLRSNSENEGAGEIANLVQTLRAGSRRFEFRIEGNILKVERGRYALVKGISYYENNKYVGAAGYIHIWDEENRTAKKAPERDYLTGVLTKAEITSLAVNIIDVKKIPNVTVSIIDIDFFKQVNDLHGHMTGDRVLKEVASIIEKEVKNDGAVGRFGGDEFLVLFYNAYDMEDMRERLRSIKNTVSAAFDREEDGKRIGITLSIGCAAYPKDADSYEDLFFLADFALYRAKEKGRNRYIIYNSGLHGDLETIRNERMGSNPLNSRGALSPAEMVCIMMDRIYTGKEYPLQELLDDISVNLNIPRVVLCGGQPCRFAAMAGRNRLSDAQIEEAKSDYLYGAIDADAYDQTGILVINNVLRFEKSDPVFYDKLCRQGIKSFLHVKFRDRNGTEGILSLEFLGKTQTWNQMLMPYYRLLGRLLENYAIN